MNDRFRPKADMGRTSEQYKCVLSFPQMEGNATKLRREAEHYRHLAKSIGDERTRTSLETMVADLDRLADAADADRQNDPV